MEYCVWKRRQTEGGKRLLHAETEVVSVKFCNLVKLILSWEGVWGKEQHPRPHINPIEQFVVLFAQNGI